MVITANPPKFDKRQPSKGGYDAIVYIDGSQVIAEDSNGRKICPPGVAGTNDSAIITQAVTNTPVGGRLIMRGDFLPESVITINKNINIDATQARLIMPPGWSIGVHMIKFVGADVLTDVALASDTLSGGTSIVIGDASSVNVGDLVGIYDDTCEDPEYPLWKRGEMHLVSAVDTDTDTITLEEGLLHDYTTILNAKVWTISPITVNVDGLEIVGLSRDTGSYVGAYAYGCKNSTFQNMTFQKCASTGIVLYRSFDILFENVLMYKCQLSSNGYGIMLGNYCTHVRIANCHGWDCRHPITMGGTANTHGYSRDISVLGGKFWGGIGSTNLDCHGGIESCVFSDVVLRDVGILIGSRHAVVHDISAFGKNSSISTRGMMPNRVIIIKDNVLIGTDTDDASGILVGGGALGVDVDYLRVFNNTLIKTQYGILIFPGTDGVYRLSEISYNHIYSSGSTTAGITTRYTNHARIADNDIHNTTRSGIVIYNATGVLIENNNVVDCNQAGLTSQLTGVGIGLSTVTQSTIRNNTISSPASTHRYSIGLITSSENKIIDNDMSGEVVSPIYGLDVASELRENRGYIAPGEVRTASGSLTAGNADAIAFAWHNPELQDILIKKVTIRITTPGGTAGSLLDVGIADDAAGTNLGTEFFNDIDLNAAAIVKSTVATPGTQTVEVFCQDSVSATDGWIVGKILVENAAALVGSYYIEYEGA